MHVLLKNTTKFEYLPMTGQESDLNDHGEHTGVFQPVRSEPVIYRGNISIPNGQTNQTFYGTDIRYTHTLIMSNPNVPIDEYGLIRWKGETFDILSVRRSQNVFTAALRRQTSDHSEDPEEPEEPEEPDEPDGDGDEP